MLHENIKKLRKQSGLTQEAFAIRLNVVRQTVSKWEKGLSVPDAQTLQRIAEEFDIPVQELLGSRLIQRKIKTEYLTNWQESMNSLPSKTVVRLIFGKFYA